MTCMMIRGLARLVTGQANEAKLVDLFELLNSQRMLHAAGLLDF